MAGMNWFRLLIGSDAVLRRTPVQRLVGYAAILSARQKLATNTPFPKRSFLTGTETPEFCPTTVRKSPSAKFRYVAPWKVPSLAQHRVRLLRTVDHFRGEGRIAPVRLGLQHRSVDFESRDAGSSCDSVTVYLWQAEGPEPLDCHGFTTICLNHAGVICRRPCRIV